MITKIKTKLPLAFIVLLLLQLYMMMAPVGAATLTSTSVRFNRMSASTASTIRVTFTVPSGNSGTEEKLRIGFPDAYTVATSTLLVTAVSCGATSLPGTLTIAGSNTPSSKNITISGVTNLTASTSYCVDIDRTTTNDPVTNPTAGQYELSVETQTSGSAQIDNTRVAARVVSNDQVVVTASVAPSFNFVLDANTTAFTADLDAATVRQTTERTVTITTNAPQGWIAWARDTNTGLTSAAAGATIPSTTPGTGATLTAGTAGYVLGVDSTDAGGGGAVTVVAAYQGTSGNNNGSGLDTAYRQVASANGTANGDILRLYGKASVTATTPAANDYTDTWTIIGAGSF